MHSMMTHSDECVDGTFSDEMEKLYGDKWETLRSTSSTTRIRSTVCRSASAATPWSSYIFLQLHLFMTMVMLNLFIGIILDAFGEADTRS